MTTFESLQRFIAAPIIAVACCVSGCISGGSSARNDRKSAAATGPVIYEMRVKEEAARLARANPGLTAKDALVAAQNSVAASYGAVGPTRTEREQSQAQDKFEADLSKLTK